MRNLSIDIETKSDIKIGRAGAFKYAQSDAFEIILFAYKEDDKDTVVVDLASGETVPESIVEALKDESITKHAYNAAFEWYCLNRAGYETPLSQWQCTMINGLYAGYPGSLKATGEAIGLPQEKQKLSTGKALIKYFCEPCKATKRNGGRQWNLPQHDEEKWKLFKEYNYQDVETEYAILQRLKYYPVPEAEWQNWRRDVEMNARGVRIDTKLVEGALAIDEASTEELMERAREITGLDNPNSPAQLTKWLEAELGREIPNLQKATVAEMLEDENLKENVREMLEIRQKLGKTSVSKYIAMETAMGEEERVRGLLQFYGASRTGRWAGRLVQVQNLPRNYLDTLDIARDLVKQKNLKGVELLYENVPDTLSQLIRTAFIPSEGGKFIVSDFSAIEARVIAWLAGEEWSLEVFRTTGKIYEATASQMFNVPVERIAKGNPEYALRQKGKVATLALGYQGGPNALVAMGALNMGIPEDELQDIVDMWRNANSHVVEAWYAIGDAALKCLTYNEPVRPQLGEYDPTGAAARHAPVCDLVFRPESDPIYGTSALSIELPSGRKLYYVEPSIEMNKFNRPALHYWNLNQTSRKWSQESTYGGKLTENIVQAIARDCLAVTLNRVIDAGYKPVMHIHDEIVIDAREDQHLDDVNEIFAQPIPWAPGLPLKGAGFESSYYMKD